MNEATDAAARALMLPDAVYQGSDRSRFDAVLDALGPGVADEAAVSPGVFALGTPSRFVAASQAGLPVVLLWRQDGHRRWSVDLRQNLSLVVVDLHTGQLRAFAPLRPTKPLARPREASRSGQAPMGGAARGVVRRLEYLSMPPPGDAWSAPAYAITAFSYDWVSNTRVLTREPAPVGLVPAAMSATPLLTPFNGPAPARGVDFAVPATVAPGAPVPVRVQFMTGPEAVVTVADVAAPSQQLLVAHLVLFQLDNAGPIIVTLGLPVQRRAEGLFVEVTFDLARLPQAHGLQGAYQIYLVSGRTVVGPRQMDVGALR